MTDDDPTGQETGDTDPEADLDGLEEDRTVQIKSPVSGVDSATGAGAVSYTHLTLPTILRV